MDNTNNRMALAGQTILSSLSMSSNVSNSSSQRTQKEHSGRYCKCCNKNTENIVESRPRKLMKPKLRNDTDGHEDLKERFERSN